MKLILLLFAAFLVVNGNPLSDDKLQILLNAHQQCGGEETEITEDVIKQTFEGSLEEDEKMKKHVWCVGKKLDFINDEGEFQTDVIKTAISDDFDNPADVLEKCAVKKDSPEESAFYFAKCLYQAKHSS